jgi:hypothetical protein
VDFQHVEELSDLGNRPCLFDAELEGVGRCSGKRKKIKPFWEWKERSTKLKIEERVVQNLLVGLEELDWSPNCGLTCKLTYVGGMSGPINISLVPYLCLNPNLSWVWVLRGSLHPWWVWMWALVHWVRIPSPTLVR